jgi:hypothetical protein
LLFEAQVSPFRCVLAFAVFVVWRQGRDFAPNFAANLGLSNQIFSLFSFVSSLSTKKQAWVFLGALKAPV